MLKFSAFLRKHFTAAGRIDPRVGLLLLLISAVVIMGTALDASSTPSAARAGAAVLVHSAGAGTPSPSASVEVAATSLPPEYLTNQQQTIGITLAAAALVLIVVIGVLAAFVQNTGDN